MILRLTMTKNALELIPSTKIGVRMRPIERPIFDTYDGRSFWTGLLLRNKLMVASQLRNTARSPPDGIISRVKSFIA